MKPTDKYPQNSESALPDGRKVSLPVHYNDFDYVFLGGVAPLKKLSPFLASEKLEPFVVSAEKDLGFAGVFFLNHKVSSLNPYHEIVFQVAVKGDNPTESPDQWFVWSLFLDQELPLKVGKVLWGFPKELAKIQFERHHAYTAFSCEVDGKTIVSGKYTEPQSQATYEESEKSNFLITPRNLKKTKTCFVSRGPRAIIPFSTEDRKQVFLSPNHPATQTLLGFGFVPTMWQVGHDMSAVQFEV